MVISFDSPFASRPLNLLASTSSSSSSSSYSSCSSYRLLLLPFLFLGILRVSRTIGRENISFSLSLPRSSFPSTPLPRFSPASVLSRTRLSIGAKQAHPLKRYATSLSTHGERERFTRRQYWSNVKPVWKPAREKEKTLSTLRMCLLLCEEPCSRVLVIRFVSNVDVCLSVA